MSPTQRQASQFTRGAISVIPWSACNRGLFKSYYCYFLFLLFGKSGKYYEKHFKFHLYIFWKKNVLVNKYKKQMCHMNLFLTFCKTFPKFAIFNMITYCSLVPKWGTLERAGRYVCKNIWNLNCQDSIYLTFFKFFKNEESTGKNFSSSCSPRCFDTNFKCLFQKMLNFLPCTLTFLNPLSATLAKWPNTVKQFVGNLPTNCLSVWPFCEIGA